MTSELKKSRGSKGKSESMQEDLPTRWGNVSRGQKTEDAAKLIKFIDDNVIGKENSFCGPYGRRKVVYCDYNGSGRALQWLEELVARDILPTHATRCTAMSYTSGQSEIYRAETHEIIRGSVGACPEDVVILGGSLPRVLRALRPQRVALFVSSRETERQIGPWRECGAEVTPYQRAALDNFRGSRCTSTPRPSFPNSTSDSYVRFTTELKDNVIPNARAKVPAAICCQPKRKTCGTTVVIFGEPECKAVQTKKPECKSVGTKKQECKTVGTTKDECKSVGTTVVNMGEEVPKKCCEVGTTCKGLEVVPATPLRVAPFNYCIHPNPYTRNMCHDFNTNYRHPVPLRRWFYWKNKKTYNNFDTNYGQPVPLRRWFYWKNKENRLPKNQNECKKKCRSSICKKIREKCRKKQEEDTNDLADPDEECTECKKNNALSIVIEHLDDSVQCIEKMDQGVQCPLDPCPREVSIAKKGYECGCGNPNCDGHSFVRPTPSYHPIPVNHLRRKVTRLPSKTGRTKKSYRNEIIAVNECTYKGHGFFDTLVDSCRNYISSNEPGCSHESDCYSHDAPMGYSHEPTMDYPHNLALGSPHDHGIGFAKHDHHAANLNEHCRCSPTNKINQNQGPGGTYSKCLCEPDETHEEHDKIVMKKKTKDKQVIACGHHEPSLSGECRCGLSNKKKQNQGSRGKYSKCLCEPGDKREVAKNKMKKKTKVKQMKACRKDETFAGQWPLNKIWKCLLPCDCKECKKEQHRKNRKEIQEKSAFRNFWGGTTCQARDEKKFRKAKKKEEKRKRKKEKKERKRREKENKKRQKEGPCIGNILKCVTNQGHEDKKTVKKQCCEDLLFLGGICREVFIIKIPESKEGFIDLNNLELRLQENSGTGKRMIGFFPAASKLTGVLADDVATTLLLHQYGAWSFWDYTLVAPSSLVDMNPTFPGVEEEMVKKDALFFNCEKFVGGVQGPYIAVVKKDVFKNAPVYSDNVEVLSERIEEWQTTDAVRAAMAMQLREAVGLQQIAERQDNITRQVLSHIKNIPELILLGNESSTVRRLPIFSLMVKHPRGTFLHHNFVCAVLNDVFGIQARGGLNSNLNYGSDVLGIDDKLLKEYEKLLDVEAQKEVARLRKKSDAKSPDVPIHNEHLRPGFCRISLPFFMSDVELAFVLEALKMVATEGWKIMPQYVVNPQTGQWRHHTCSVLRDKKSLFAIRFNDGRVTSHERRVSGPGIFPQTYTECLQTARNLFNRARKLAMKCPIAEPEVAFHPKIDYLRWFMLPKEAHDLLLGRSGNVKHIVPFDPSGFTGARKSLHSRSCVNSSPIFGASGRHFSLSAIDDCDIYSVKHKQKFYTRESSLKEQPQKETNTNQHPVKFAVGESVSPLRLLPHLSAQPSRLRCYSLGSDMPQAQLSAQAKLNLGLKETSPNKVIEKISSASSFCNCGSQTDLLSLDDPMISPGRAPSSTSISDCSQVGRNSPTASLNSQTSEEHIHAYVKEMTKEIATEIKSEIREVISQVDDILENSDSLEQSNISMNSTSSQNERNSVSVIDVAEYLMGMSREMASEVKHEIREMVSQVDEMMSPEGTCSRKSSPPKSGRQRIGSGPELGLDLKRGQNAAILRKCPTSPVLPTQYADDEDRFCKRSPSLSPKSAQCTPSHDSSGPSSISFNSSETSTPDTIIQVVTTQNSPTLPKSLSSNKLSDDEISCNDVNCRQCCVKKNWCQNPSISSQDSGINLSFTETESYQDIVKWRTSSDPTTNKGKKLQGRLRMCQRYEKIEVPDIIEGVPVCSEDYTRLTKRYSEAAGENGRVVFQIPDDGDRQNRGVRLLGECKRTSRSSNASSSSSEHSSRSSGYGTDISRPSLEDHYFDRSEAEYRLFKDRWEDEQDDSSACSDTSLTDFTYDDDSKWHSLPKAVWKATVEAIHEFNMVRPGDKVLVCLSGGRESIALLHAMHQYQFYARAKGVHFSIGALFVHDHDSDVDPLHLMAYCRTLGVKLIYQDNLEEDNPHRRHSSVKLSELQRWASHAVRRRAYLAAAAHGYSVAAVAQHLDHAARVFLTNAFHGGALTSVKAHYRVREHNVRIIRPFIYVRARSLAEWCEQHTLPALRPPTPRSPASDDSNDSNESNGSNDSNDTGKEVVLERSVSDPCSPAEKRAARRRRGEGAAGDGPLAAAAALLHEQEAEHPFLFSSLKHALHPLISARNIDKDLKESRHRKKSVIQMKDGAPVYDSEEGTEEEPVP